MKKILLLFYLLFLLTNLGFGQWFPSGNTGQTTTSSPAVDFITIGCYTCNSDFPVAALDVNIPYTFSGAAGGSAFRTVAKDNYDHTWEMWTFGDNQGKFRV
jgi:hypothetical protein